LQPILKGFCKTLKGFDLAIIAKPTEAFTDAEKVHLGSIYNWRGKSLWLIASGCYGNWIGLFNEKCTAMALPTPKT